MTELCSIDGCVKPPKLADKYCSMHRARLTRTGRFDLKTPYERLIERSKLNEETGCIEYTRYKNKHGYGRLRAGGKKVLAHRLSYEHSHGAIPDGIIICHKCDNPSCINPEHLFAGTHLDNARDAIAKGRVNPTERAKNRWIKCPTFRK